MAGYTRLNLSDMIAELGEDKTIRIISEFSCPLNTDVEDFLKHKAIEFAKQQISQTHLVFALYKNTPILVGYFTLANKIVNVAKKHLSKTSKKRISKFSQYSDICSGYPIPMPLIAQLGKNYANGYDCQISGDELLKMACDTVRQAQRIIGGKFVYLECEDKERLISFYVSNGFIEFGERMLDADEKNHYGGQFLIQMLKYLR